MSCPDCQRSSPRLPTLTHGPRHQRQRVALVLCALILVNGIVRASEIEPFYSFNQSPIVQIYGLPGLGSARVLESKQTRVELNEIIANNFTGAPLAGETLLLDGESYRTTLSVARGFSQGMEMGIEIPYVSIRGGHLDGLIEDFHDILGFADGGRSAVPSNRLRYSYTRGGTTLLDINEPASGVGDIRLTGAWQWHAPQSNSSYLAALRASLKLPTGNADQLLGSGGSDLALWVSFACNSMICGNSLQWYGGLGGLYVGKGDVLSALQRDFVGFGTIGIGWPLWPDFRIQAQLDGHTPFYRNSEFDQLSGYAAQLLIGFSWRLAARTAFELALSEDVIEDSSPDVAFHFRLRTHF